VETGALSGVDATIDSTVGSGGLFLRTEHATTSTPSSKIFIASILRNITISPTKPMLAKLKKRILLDGASPRDDLDGIRLTPQHRATADEGQVPSRGVTCCCNNQR